MTASSVFLLALFGLLGAGTWVAISLFASSWVVVELFTTAPAVKLLPTAVWGMVASWPLTALPMFVWMGEILYRTRLAKDMFEALAPLLVRLPGRHVHLNVVCCGVFAAVCGSSAATAATIGRITLPELASRGYGRGISLGSLAASGALGILIPPSIPMIVYGISAEVSIARLFVAGFLPGLLMMALFMGYIALDAVVRRRREVASGGIAMPAAAPAAEGEGGKLLRIIPVILLVIAVIGSLYTGIATPTEAAVVGVIGALVFAAATRALSWASFVDGLRGTLNTSLMILFIMAASAFLSTSMGMTGVPTQFAEWVARTGLSQVGLLIVLTVFFTILGCFLDGLSMIVLTAAVVLPAVQHAGIDPLWFGIYMVIVIEMAQLTPPVGFNLFVVQGITGVNMWRVALYSLPFFLLMVITLVLIFVFPQIVTILPDTMMRG